MGQVKEETDLTGQADFPSEMRFAVISMNFTGQARMTRIFFFCICTKIQAPELLVYTILRKGRGLCNVMGIVLIGIIQVPSFSAPLPCIPVGGFG